MKPTATDSPAIDAAVFGWIFSTLFFAIGVLNALLVHPVPGVFYLILAVLYAPMVGAAIRRRTGFAVPPIVQILVGLAILWGTLAVGDLAEMFGF